MISRDKGAASLFGKRVAAPDQGQGYPHMVDSEFPDFLQGMIHRHRVDLLPLGENPGL